MLNPANGDSGVSVIGPAESSKEAQFGALKTAISIEKFSKSGSSRLWA
jgi:hypothetical protein